MILQKRYLKRLVTQRYYAYHSVMNKPFDADDLVPVKGQPSFPVGKSFGRLVVSLIATDK
jgi:hypothetical protein